MTFLPYVLVTFHGALLSILCLGYFQKYHVIKKFMAGFQTTASLMMIQGGSLCADINKSFSPVCCDSESATIVAAFCLVFLSANT